MLLLILVTLLGAVSARNPLATFGGSSFASAPRCDPAPSWMAYSKAAGNGRTVKSVSTSWQVPAYPTELSAPSAPGFWFGIEPQEPNACNLIQPILAYDYTVSEAYVIFLGYFEWDNSTWWFSETGSVAPGDWIDASITLINPGVYRQEISSRGTGFSISHDRVVEAGKGPYSDTYFVIEHQVEDCKQLPSNGGIVFSNITISYVGTNQTFVWANEQFQDVCNVSSTNTGTELLNFTWQTQ